MPYKIAQIAVNPKNNTEVLSKIYLSQPSMEEEQLLGKLFVLAEIKNRKPDIALASFIIDRINLFYYQNEQIPLLARLATVTVSDIFESSLAKLNQAIVAFIQSEKIHVSGDDCNLTIGIIFKNKVYFCNLGHNKALLIYKPKIKSNRQINGYDLLNITLSTADPTQDVVLADKLFTNTISGAIPADSYFVFTNEALHEFLTEAQLVKIITTLQPSGAAEQIKNILEQTNIYMPFIGLIIKNQLLSKKTDEAYVLAPSQRVMAQPTPAYHSLATSREREPSFRQERDLNKESIKTLNRTAAKTDQILRSPGFINPIKIKQLFYKLKAKFPVLAKKQNKLLLKRDNLTWLRKEGLVSLKKIGDGLLKAGALAWTVGQNVRQTLARKEAKVELQERLAVTKERLGKKHLIMMGIIALAVIGLVFSLYWSNIQKIERQKNTAFIEASQQFSDREKQIQGDLIYNNKNNAQGSLEEMSVLIQTLSANTGKNKKHAEEYQAINIRYQKLVDDVSGLVRLTQPEVVFSLDSSKTASALSLAGDKIYLTIGANISELNPATKELKDLTTEEANPIFLNSDKDGRSWWLAGATVISLDSKTGQIKKQTLNGAPATSLTGTVYNNRLYLFDGTSKQIYRFTVSNGNFGNSTPWLTQTLAGDATGMAIETSVYLLFNNQIMKFDNGAPNSTPWEQPFPALASAQSLIAPSGTDLLLTIDKTSKRVVIFSRNTGKPLSQYTSDNWTDLKSLAFDNTSQTVYVLNGQDIVRFKLKK